MNRQKMDKKVWILLYNSDKLNIYKKRGAKLWILQNY
jgi:hypothetical protein